LVFRKHLTVLPIELAPDKHFRSFGIYDETVEVKDQSI